jgi:hypothetical protein
LPKDAKPNDLVFWHTDLEVDHLDALSTKLKERATRRVSTRVVVLGGVEMEPVRSFILRDPDGHALQLEQHAEPTASAQR